MTNILQDGAGWLGSQLQGSAGRQVTIRRQQFVSDAIVGWVTNEYDEVGDDGMTTSITVVDWRFVASDVVINGEQVEPRDHDMIVETLNGVEHTYEVLPLQKRKACEWLDDSGVLLLVHSKIVKRVA